MKNKKPIKKSSTESINYRHSRPKKQQDPRYEGLEECFRNVRKTGTYGKLSYCL